MTNKRLADRGKYEDDDENEKKKGEVSWLNTILSMLQILKEYVLEISKSSNSSNIKASPHHHHHHHCT